MNVVLNPPTNIRNRMAEEVGKLFVGAVSQATTGDAFRAYFEGYGRISDCVLMMDRETGKNKGYGFVKYEDPRCAEDVLAAKPGHVLDGKGLDVKACTARGTKPRGIDDQRTKKVFVGGISQQANQDDVRNTFRQYGVVEDVHIMIDNETGKHRGFGFVTLDSEEAVEKLVRIHHLELKGKTVEIKKAMPKTFKAYQSGPPSRPGGPGGPGQMGGGGGFQQGGGGGNWNQGGQPGYGGGPGGPGGGGGGGFGGANQWNMGQPMGQYGQQQGGFQQRGGPGGGPGFGGQQQQQGFSNGYRQQGQGGGQPPYGQQQGGGGYGQQQQQQHPPQQQNYGGKPNAGGDSYGKHRPQNGGQGYGNYGNYGQQQQHQPPQQQYGNQGSMGNYPQEASGYGPQRVNYNQQQGYNQGQFGNNVPGQNFGPPQQQMQQQHPPPQQQQHPPPQQHQQQQQQMPPQGYGQQADGGPGMYGNNNFGRGNNMGGGNQFHPYRRFQGNQVQ